jgi:hypothetical protein
LFIAIFHPISNIWSISVPVLKWFCNVNCLLYPLIFMICACSKPCQTIFAYSLFYEFKICLANSNRSLPNNIQHYFYKFSAFFIIFYFFPFSKI